MKPVFSLTITIILAAVISTNAQITFSRDWFAGSGKRSYSPTVIHKPHKRGNENLDMLGNMPRHGNWLLKRNPTKKEFSENGPGVLSKSHIQDLNRAIEYLQTLKNGFLTEEFDDLEGEMQHAVAEHASDVVGNIEQHIPRSFQRL